MRCAFYGGGEVGIFLPILEESGLCFSNFGNRFAQFIYSIIFLLGGVQPKLPIKRRERMTLIFS